MNQYQHACYLNARSLLKAANLLFEKRMYGHASALAVLSIEECGKGFLFMIHKPDKDNESFVRKQIKSHTEKLGFAAKDIYLMGLEYEGFITKKNPIKSLEDFEKRVEHLHVSGNKKFLDLVVGSYLIQQFQPLKERGLYIDLEKGKILSPKSIKKEQAKFVITQAERAVKYFPKSHGKKT